LTKPHPKQDETLGGNGVHRNSRGVALPPALKLIIVDKVEANLGV